MWEIFDVIRTNSPLWVYNQLTMNEEMLIIVVIVRLLAPLIIFRFPITGFILATILDWQDFNLIGHHAYYQIIDKWLDFYMLTICAITTLGWKDSIVKKLALWLYGYRALGVVLLTIFNAEWLLFIFPDFFGFFYIFYMLYVRFSGSQQLSKNWLYLLPALVSLFSTKIIQEYTLHVAFPFRSLVPSWFTPLMEWPLAVQVLLLAILPAAALLWYVWRARIGSAQSPLVLATKQTHHIGSK